MSLCWALFEAPHGSLNTWPPSFRLFGNRSLCYERLQQYENACRDADVALLMEPKWIKGLFRKGKALCGLKVKHPYPFLISAHSQKTSAFRTFRTVLNSPSLVQRYYEASLIYREVLDLDSSSMEAKQELKRAQTLHLTVGVPAIRDLTPFQV